LVLIGGGEFSFGETAEIDQAWMQKIGDGPVGFLPTASGSADYFHHFADYLGERFSRKVELIPVYRGRDAKREKNAERVAKCAAIYIGGGVPDELLSILSNTPIQEELGSKLGSGGVVVAIAAAAQAMGHMARSLFGGSSLPGMNWLPGGVIEPNFDPGHDRRLRRMMAEPGVEWGIGLPASAAVLLGPDNQTEVIGTSFLLDDREGDFRILGG
jgi:cyanophycinase-like exopeptidase